MQTVWDSLTHRGHAWAATLSAVRGALSGRDGGKGLAQDNLDGPRGWLDRYGLAFHEEDPSFVERHRRTLFILLSVLATVVLLGFAGLMWLWLDDSSGPPGLDHAEEIATEEGSEPAAGSAGAEGAPSVEDHQEGSPE